MRFLAAKVATVSIAGAGVGIGSVFAGYLNGLSRNPGLKRNVLLVFAYIGGTILFIYKNIDCLTYFLGLIDLVILGVIVYHIIYKIYMVSLYIFLLNIRHKIVVWRISGLRVVTDVCIAFIISLKAFITKKHGCCKILLAVWAGVNIGNKFYIFSKYLHSTVFLVSDPYHLLILSFFCLYGYFYLITAQVNEDIKFIVFFYFKKYTQMLSLVWIRYLEFQKQYRRYRFISAWALTTLFSLSTDSLPINESKAFKPIKILPLTNDTKFISTNIIMFEDILKLQPMQQIKVLSNEDGMDELSTEDLLLITVVVLVAGGGLCWFMDVHPIYVFAGLPIDRIFFRR